jgi:serine protease Do
MENPLSQTPSRPAPLAAAVAAFLLLVFAAPAPAAARGAPDSFADLAERLLPAVVNVSTTQVIRSGRSAEGEEKQPEFHLPPGSPFDQFRDFFEHQRPEGSAPRRATSLGSGFIIDSKGLVVTNEHVVADADEITVILHDQTELKAKVIGRDAKTDLALLKVDTPHPLPALKWGNSDKTRVGDWIVAIGNPFGLGGSVTAGILSARGRNINVGPYDDFLQTDASINKGNSGGPMFNMDGEVIGINTAIFSPTGGSVGIGFAIPSSLAEPVIEQLRDYGKMRRGWIGVRIQSVSEEIAQSIGLEHPSGALVASVSDQGPAAKAGLSAGDVILKFNNQDVGEMRRLPRIVADSRVGATVPIDVWRHGGLKHLSITLGELPEEQQVASVPASAPESTEKTSAVAEIGLVLAPLNGNLREKFNLSGDVKGVVVTEVRPNSAAADKRIRPGDVILNVGPDQAAVTTPAQVKAKIDEARKAKVKNLLVRIETEGNPRFVILRLDGKG